MKPEPMSVHDTLELVQSLLAFKAARAGDMLTTMPGDFANGYRGAVLECLSVVNELLKAERQEG